MNLPADKIPTDATAFKKWADAACAHECRDWPVDLQVLAYRAWQWLADMKFRSAADHEAFMAGYRKFTGAAS
jgi:hypothetical protein